VIARFEAERQALALMDHPHIARVLDAGATEAGRPYFVMELVQGEPIAAYCDQNRLSIAERLGLFTAVCQAVQHAHTKGILHRDVKPSNILVTRQDGKPVVKVIDFGIAKALGQPLTEKTLCTGIAQLVGTPLYMSPEQAAPGGLDVDTRSDVYALGVLLYELLTGTTPLDPGRLKGAGYDELRRIICEEEPPRPSARVGALGEAAGVVAANRQSDPRRLGQLLRGELDWVALRALEKDRERRYQTPAALAADVEHYRRDEPVAACPPSVGYRCRKFVRRHRGAVLTGAGALAALLAVVAAVAGSIGWATRDRAARDAALDREVGVALDEAEALIEKAGWPEALAAVDRADKLLAAAGRGERPARLAELRKDLEMARRLEDLYGQPIISESADYFTGMDAACARAFRDYGIDLAELPVAQAASRLRGRTVCLELAQALDFWSAVRRRSGKRGPPDWKQLLEVARAADPDAWRSKLRAALQNDDREALKGLAASADVRRLPPKTLHLLAVALNAVGLRGQAGALLRKAQRQYPGDVWINEALGWHCRHYLRPPQYDEAVRFYTAAVAVRPRSPYLRAVLGSLLAAKESFAEAVAEISKAIELKPDYVDAHANLGIVLERQGKWAKAEAAYREAARLKPDYAEAHGSLGRMLELQGKFPEAEAAFRAEIACRKATGHKLGCAAAHHNLGLVLRRQGKMPAAEAAYREAIRLNKDHAPAHANLGEVLLRREKLAEAEAEVREALRLKPAFATAHSLLGLVLERQGKLPAAEAAHREAIRLKKDFAEAHYYLGIVLERQGKPGAEAALREALRLKKNFAEAHLGLGTVLHRQGKLPAAAVAFREAIRLKPGYALAHYNLGQALRLQGKLPAAEAAYREAVCHKPDCAEAHWGLGLVLEGQGKLPAAEAAYREAIRHKKGYAEAHNSLGVVLSLQGRFPAAEVAFRDAIRHKTGNALAHCNLGVVLRRQGKWAEAEAAFRESLRLRYAPAHSSLAWLLATCADPKFRKPHEALALAERAAKLAPKDSFCWRTLGAARYRVGDCRGALVALEKAAQARKGGDSWDLFFLAMTHWQLGDRGKARQCYDRAVSRMEKHLPKDQELGGLRAEAEGLLGIEKK
jgi:serine/threonine-protein kinase